MDLLTIRLLEYVEVVNECQTKNMFSVTEMTTDKFVNLNNVARFLTERTVTNDREKIDFSKLCQFCMTREKGMSVEIKLNHDDNVSEQWKLVSFQKIEHTIFLF